MILIIFILLMFFNTQIAMAITHNETKGERIILKIIVFIMCFFVWPMLLLSK